MYQMHICCQITQEEVAKKEPLLTSVHDLIHQLQELSDEVDVSESREQAYRVSQDIHELSQRLTRRKTKVQVGLQFFAV